MPSTYPFRIARAALLGLAAACALVPVGAAAAAPAQRSGMRPALRKQVDRAIDRGLAYLLSGPVNGRSSRDGSRNTDGLAVYAALHSGARASDQHMEAALNALARNRHDGTYVTACALMALGAGHDSDQRGKVQKLTQRLIRTQRNGAWGYPSGEDLSNTQYAALGLWAAERAGAEVPPKVWVALAGALPDFTGPTGGFGYVRHHSAPSMSMTAAGLACAALCRERLDRGGAGGVRLTDELRHGLELMEARSIEWMADRFAATGGERGHYALYGIERAAALAGVERFGDHDWYADGALYLVGTQQASGEWAGSHGSVATTCFALLFLARATSKVVRPPVSGPTSGAVLARAEDGGLGPLSTHELERLHRRDLGRNRTAAAAARAKSSTRVARHRAEQVLDERRETWWSCSDSDRSPALRLTFGKPTSIDTILVSHAPPEARAEGEPPSLDEVTVIVNGTDRYTLPMPEDGRRKGRLELPEAVELRRLELECTRRDDAARVDVGEVEIQTRPR